MRFLGIFIYFGFYFVLFAILSFFYFFFSFVMFIFFSLFDLHWTVKKFGNSALKFAKTTQKLNFATCWYMTFDIRRLTFDIWHWYCYWHWHWNWHWHWLWLAMEINWVLEPLRDHRSTLWLLSLTDWVNPPEPWEISKGPFAQISCVLRLKLKSWDQFEEKQNNSHEITLEF